MKRVLSFALSLLLAVCLTLPVAAAEPVVLTTDAFASTARLSVTDGYSTGAGLAFCFTLNAANIKKDATTHKAKLTDAKLTYQGAQYSITAIGAVLSNRAMDESELTLDSVNGGNCIHIPAQKLYQAEADYAMYAARVVNIPYEMEERTLYARPYVEIDYNGERITLYGAIASASYASAMSVAYVRLPSYGDDIDGKGRLFVGNTTALCDTMYIEIQDEPDEWTTNNDPDRPDKIFYACYGEDGSILSEGELELPAMSSAYAATTLMAPLAEGTTEVRITGADIIYWTEWDM